MRKEIVCTEHAPEAVGPYCQGILWGDLLFTAGQIPLEPETGKLVSGNLENQVRRVIENLGAVLEAGGSGLDSVLRLDVFLTDMTVFPMVNVCLAEVFDQSPPARVTVEVSRLPLGAGIEMAAIAVKRGTEEG